MESMRTFADQLWKYMVPKLDSKFASNVSYFRAQVVSNPGNNKLEVQRPMENGTLTLPCVRAMSGAQAGQQVVALVMGSMSNAIIVGDGKLNVPGGGGDAGIADFQAQPDGSLVITLTDGTTFTATPIINAFANVQVGSTTISADNNADTLTLIADGLVSMTGNAANDSVTIFVDPNHTHITVQVLDLVNADSHGPSDLVTLDADVAEVPLKNCVVNIEPVQAGSGDPSPTNVRAISGWSGAQIHISPTTSASDGRTVSVDWSAKAGTVYGGTLDVLTGTLTVDRAFMTLTSNLDWRKSSLALSGGRSIFYNRGGIADCKLSSNTGSDRNENGVVMQCSHYDIGSTSYYSLRESDEDFAMGIGTSAGKTDIGFLIEDSLTGGTAAGLGTWLTNQINAGTPVQIVYPLASPVTYQLSPQIISTLLETNNIWADCGTISVDYGAFLSALDKAIDEHSEDSIRHVTEAEREMWNSKADSPHTHDASDITSGILPAERGGTQNENGYIQMGQKAGATVGFCSTAEGLQTQSLGSYCHAEGYATTAGTTASNSAYAHSEGQNTIASGNASHSEGSYTTSSGGSSHAEGSHTVASGQNSHSEGRYTTANHRSQHVFGEYNTADNSSAQGTSRGDYVEIVGNGTSESARSNARTLDWSGNEWIAGTLTQASDARLKNVQGEIPDLSSIRAVRFRWKNGDDKEHLGYLAQDVEEIAPYLVGVDSNGYKSLDYIALLTAKVEMLEREIEKLRQ